MNREISLRFRDGCSLESIPRQGWRRLRTYPWQWLHSNQTEVMGSIWGAANTYSSAVTGQWESSDWRALLVSSASRNGNNNFYNFWNFIIFMCLCKLIHIVKQAKSINKVKLETVASNPEVNLFASMKPDSEQSKRGQKLPLVHLPQDTSPSWS